MTTLIHLEERQSNASVECWFNFVKNHILAGKTVVGLLKT